MKELFMKETEGTSYSHFNGKDALRHIVEVQAEGAMVSSEVHGAETPGSLFAGFDSARDAAVMVALIQLLLSIFGFPQEQTVIFLIAFSAAFISWKAGRSSWLAWARLERLHRIAAEEQKEILENRPQEREELKALYRAKGFEGRLLDEVVDVLMADSDRLLRVMLQEEMGFRLEENEHPLIQGLGAMVGAFVGACIPIMGYYYFDGVGALMGAAISLGAFAGISAYRERNQVIHAIVWNLGMGIFSYAIAYYFMQLVRPGH